MGVNLKDIIPAKPLMITDLEGKTLAVDALNTLYQFLASIRQPDGTPLMDSQGRITSHISGILYRTSNYIRYGIKPIYVFDGKPPDLKLNTLRERRKRKEQATQKMLEAQKDGRIADAAKYAKRTSKMTSEMMEEAKKVIELMGVPWVQAPCEGEAQCTHIVKRGDAWAVASQDYDSLLFGAPKLLRGLSMSGNYQMTMIELKEALKELKIDREQLIDLAILVGTDFDPGVYGIGPKKALKAVQDGTVDEIEKEFDMDAVRAVFLEHPVTDDYNINFGKVDRDGLVNFLSKEYNFSEERIKRVASELERAYKEQSQQSLDRWF